MSVSKDRIERAVNAVRREAGCGKTCPLEKGCMCRNVTVAALTADAPALLAARVEGMREAREITSAGYFRTKVAETPGDAIVFHIQQTRAAIDRRIAELSRQEAGT